MSALLRDRVDGIWYRRADKAILDEVPGVYGNVPVGPGDVVLDVGAHIGISCRLWLRKRAAKVIAVEADPANVAILRKNLAGLPHVRILAAAVGPELGTTSFYVKRGYGYVGSIHPGPGRERRTVPVVTLGSLLERWQPTVVKADIEFAEYGLPELRALPEHVRVLAMEVHVRLVMEPEHDLADLRRRREAAAELIAAIEAQGFVATWRRDKPAKPGQPPAEPDDSGLAPMTKCVCATWVRA